MTPTGKQAIIDRAYSKFIKDFDSINSELYKALQKELYLFDIQDGKFVDSNLAPIVVAKLKRELKKILLSSSVEYKSKVQELIRDLDVIEQANIEVQKGVNAIAVSKKLITPTKKFYVDKVTADLIEAGVDQAFIKPISETLMKNIVLGSSVSESADFLKNYVLGNAEKEGKLQQYAKQIARDAISQYDGQLNQVFINEFGLDAIQYVGGLVDDSRGQCVRWVGMGKIKFSELQNEIDLAYENQRAKKITNGHRWGGMIDGTTPQNFCVNRGGWHCAHTAIAVYSKTKR